MQLWLDPIVACTGYGNGESTGHYLFSKEEYNEAHLPRAIQSGSGCAVGSDNGITTTNTGSGACPLSLIDDYGPPSIGEGESCGTSYLVGNKNRYECEGLGRGLSSGEDFLGGKCHGEGRAIVSRGTERIIGGNLYKLVDSNLESWGGFEWTLEGDVEASGPFNYDMEEECPLEDGDGICVGATVRALESGGLKLNNENNRVLLVRVDPEDVLGSSMTKIRARKVAVIREATEREILDFIKYDPLSHRESQVFYR